MKRTNHTANRLLLCLTLAITASLCSQHAIVLGQTDAKEPAAVEPVMFEQSIAEARIEAALLEQTSVEFVETPLNDVAAFLSKQHDIPIGIDVNDLELEGHGVDTPITADLPNIRLQSALQLMLAESELTYIIRDEMLMITTQTAAELEPITQVYDVRDLMQQPNSLEPDIDRLSVLITDLIAPRSWDERGGPGSLDFYQGTLVVSQSREVHQQVQGLLTQLRRAKHALEHDPQRAISRTWRVSEVDQTAVTARIWAAFDKPVKRVEFLETPLHEAAAFLEKQMQIPIELNLNAIESEGIGDDSPLTANLTNLSLRSVLNHLLDTFQLTYVVRNEVLLITTQEQAAAQPDLAVFVVRDLFESPESSNNDANRLMDLITNTIAPRAWSEQGGLRRIAYFEPCDALVVAQTADYLAKVEALLGKLRKLRNQREPWSAEKWARQQAEYLSEPHFEYYTVEHDMDGKMLADPELVAEHLKQRLHESLREKIQIRVTKNSLTMMLTPLDRFKVEAILHDANLPVYRTQHAGGGFMEPLGSRGRRRGRSRTSWEGGHF